MFNLLKQRFCVLLCSFFVVTSVHAESARDVEFKVITGYGSSTAILNGDYQQAVELAKVRGVGQTPYDRAVNANSLCVAYAKLAQVEQALDACSNAVRVSRRVGSVTDIDRVAMNNRNIVRKYAASSQIR